MESNNNEFLYNYSNSLPNLLTKEVITSIIVLLLAQRLFAVFILYLMTLSELKDIYKEDAILRNLDDLIKIQKAFNKFESENITIQSKGMQHFISQKQQKEKIESTSPLSQRGQTFDFLRLNQDTIGKLMDNDPIKKWYAEEQDLSQLLLEKNNFLKNDKKPTQKKMFLKSKISETEANDQKDIAIIEDNQQNEIFREILEKDTQKNNSRKDKNNVFEEDDSDSSDLYELDTDEKVPNSLKIQQKLFPNISSLDPILEKVKPTDKPETCEFCGKVFSNFFYKKEGLFCPIAKKWFCDKDCSAQKYFIPSLIWNDKNYQKQWISKEGEDFLSHVYQ